MRAPSAASGASARVFGSHLGAVVHEITLRSDAGLEAKILTWGAVIRDLSLPMPGGLRRSLVLGFESFDAYQHHSGYFGAVVGRYANRIAGGSFTLDGRAVQLDRNEAGRTTLHGGAVGFSSRVWTLVDRSGHHVTLALTSADGDQGFPGEVRALCSYTLGPGNRLEFAVFAQTSRPTPVNLAQHSYFNLDGGPDLQGHLLTVHADAYTPVGDAMIPTGAILAVKATAYDFTAARALTATAPVLNHNFVLRRFETGADLRPAAELVSLRSGIRLRVATTKPGVQIYDGHLLDVAVGGLGGTIYGAKSGLCLETQYFPDSPNQPRFPNSILAPGTDYRHRTVYAFDRQ